MRFRFHVKPSSKKNKKLGFEAENIPFTQKHAPVHANSLLHSHFSEIKGSLLSKAYQDSHH